jgi:hypothetical protein
MEIRKKKVNVKDLLRGVYDYDVVARRRKAPRCTAEEAIARSHDQVT